MGRSFSVCRALWPPFRVFSGFPASDSAPLRDVMNEARTDSHLFGMAAYRGKWGGCQARAWLAYPSGVLTDWVGVPELDCAGKQGDGNAGGADAGGLGFGGY